MATTPQSGWVLITATTSEPTLDPIAEPAPSLPQVLITAGRATLTPSDGEPPLTIGKGDAVYFHRGFKCDWHVHERMTKHYAVSAL